MSDTESCDDHVLGSLSTADGAGVVRMQDRLATDIDDLWAVLTDPGRLHEWLGDIEGDLQPGGSFRAFFFASEWEGIGRIETCERPRHVLVHTREDEQGHEHALEVTLTPDGEHTHLLWEERGLPVAWLAAYGTGIQIHIEDLAAHLAGRGRCDSKSRFDELFPAYKALPVRAS